MNWNLTAEDVRSLAELGGINMEQTENFAPVFYDIETTGLSRSASYLYLIGAVYQENARWKLVQWMGQSEADEPALLETFSDFLMDFTLTIQYNGDSFDAPYLEARCEKYGLASSFQDKEALDLYRALKPLKGLFGLESMKQPDLEAFLGRGNRIFVDGKECIRLYKTYVLRHSDALAAAVLGHNAEDLSGLLAIYPLLGCLALSCGSYDITAAAQTDSQVCFTLALPHAIPTKIAASVNNFAISAENQTAIVDVKAPNRKLRRYYPNYKDYYYLPGEDTAIPKALGAFLDKSLRKPARPETCYTWFSCTDEFLKNPASQKEYLTALLPVMLNQKK